ncbi:MAG TPA: pyrroloquinoline quinone biosynthesis protein PqqE [Candidatus Binatus sp.]|uniref:pyrroloquinoline quinone biosynthesis protein PqqE n=1 Tax=Candidatus Binatus sp. TaxID=2811406 RepID=UPI002B46AE68|nr:pyrroloquinoline quinone biosynthesis protein PqqE [Candidatus Binatus sp.]HKN14257.1 pyrroloquinoline quinone biosynthesis protein PqqE [Candidatus Binatus sp.]
MIAASRPYTLVAELTYRCPLRCVYCSNPVNFHRSRSELSTGEWRRVFSEAAELGVMQLHFSGGEPVLRDDLVELIQDARAHDLYTNLITGGTLLDEDKLRRLREAGLDHIQLSIQGAARESAETIAAVRSHRKKLEVARLIGKIGFPLTLNVVIHRLNIAEVPELIGIALELGANRLELANTQFYAWAAENRRALMPTREQYDRAEGIAREAIVKYRGTLEIAFVQNDYLSGEPKPCMGGWGRSYICINPTGEVMPCHAASVIPGLRFDSVRDGALEKIWRDSPAMNAFRGDDWMMEPCRTCARKEIDFGGCRCQAFMLAGNAAEADPICRLSPHNGIVESMRKNSGTDAPLIYRDAKTSRKLSKAIGSL